jgi:hypothetical protein
VDRLFSTASRLKLGLALLFLRDGVGVVDAGRR